MLGAPRDRRVAKLLNFTQETGTTHRSIMVDRIANELNTCTNSTKPKRKGQTHLKSILTLTSRVVVDTSALQLSGE
jgi:hypothetical protein